MHRRRPPPSGSPILRSGRGAIRTTTNQARKQQLEREPSASSKRRPPASGEPEGGGLPRELLQRISGEILERTKELGCFDEMRMRLLESVEQSDQFARVESQFKREVGLFCSSANLGLPRSKLREKLLNPNTLQRSMSRLREHVHEIVHKQSRPQLRQLYQQQALEYLKSRAGSCQAGVEESGGRPAASESPLTESSGTFSLSPCKTETPELLSQIPLPAGELPEAPEVPERQEFAEQQKQQPVAPRHTKKYKRFRGPSVERIEIKIRPDSVCYGQHSQNQSAATETPEAAGEMGADTTDKEGPRKFLKFKSHPDSLLARPSRDLSPPKTTDGNLRAREGRKVQAETRRFAAESRQTINGIHANVSSQ